MVTIILFLVVLVAIALIWVFSSKSPLASALRGRISGKEQEAADWVDSVQSRLDTALLKHKQLIDMARSGLYKVKITLAERNQEVDHWQKEADQAAQDKVLARNANNRDAFAAACANYDHAIAMLGPATAARDQIATLVTQMEQQVDVEHNNQDAMEIEAATTAASAVVDETAAKIGEAKAGLSKDDGGTSDMEKARQIAAKLHGRAMAASGVADGMTEHERQVNALKALHADAAKTNVDDEWKAVGDKISGSKPA